MSYKTGGFYNDKYIISKSSGEIVDSEAKYFVLRYDKDPNARNALEAYANSVQSQNPELAKDIRNELSFSKLQFIENQEKETKC